MGRFSNADLELLAMLGHLVAIIIENIKLYNKMKFTIDKLNRKNLEITSLADLDEFLGTLKDEAQVADYSILNVIEFLKAQYGALYCFRDKGNHLVKVSEAGSSDVNNDFKTFEKEFWKWRFLNKNPLFLILKQGFMELIPFF